MTTTIEAPEAVSEQQLKRQGMERAIRSTDPVWRQYAYLELTKLAQSRRNVHVDDLHAVIEWHPSSPNAWGSIWQRAIRDGVLAKTGLYRATRLPGKHAHEYPVYRSMIYRQQAA